MITRIYIVILFSLILVSCEMGYQHPYIQDANTNQVYPDTTSMKFVYSGSYCYPAIFEAAFDSSSSMHQGKRQYSFSTKKLGYVNVETRKILVGDPILLQDLSVLPFDFPNGDFALQISYLKKESYSASVYCRVLFSDSIPVNWIYGFGSAHTPVASDDSIIDCFSVDAGIAIIADAQTAKAFNAKGMAKWKEVFVEKVSKHPDGFIHYLDTRNIAVFPTGYGDGCYAAYVGLDSNKKICRLLIDFNVIDRDGSMKK